MGADLIPLGDDSPYAVLRTDPAEMQEMILATLGGAGLTMKDLDRVKVPSGGGTTWEVPTLDGQVGVSELTGVIISQNTRRSYWPYAMEDRPDDADGRPQCQSNDGIMGVGDPGGPCNECPYNEFESDIKGGAGKACKETKMLFLLTENDLLPLALSVPPASLANVRAYLIRLLRAQLAVTSVVTKLTLVKDKNAKGTAYARVEFARAATLSPEAAARMRQYSAQVAPAIQATAEKPVGHDEV